MEKTINLSCFRVGGELNFLIPFIHAFVVPFLLIIISDILMLGITYIVTLSFVYGVLLRKSDRNADNRELFFKILTIELLIIVTILALILI